MTGPEPPCPPCPECGGPTGRYGDLDEELYCDGGIDSECEWEEGDDLYPRSRP